LFIKGNWFLRTNGFVGDARPACSSDLPEAL